jgi:hypothetical protein
MYKNPNSNKYDSIGVCTIFIATLIGIISFGGLITVNHIAVIAAATAQQTNSTIISNSTILAGDIYSCKDECNYGVAGQWNMSLEKPLSQSQANPIAKTFDSSFTLRAFCCPAFEPLDKFTISNFKQTSAAINGKILQL